MPALADALIFDNLHGIGDAVGESISGFHSVAYFDSDASCSGNIHGSRADRYIAAALRCVPYSSHATTHLREHSTAREH